MVMRRLLYTLQCFMSGRNGADGLNFFILILYAVVAIVSAFVTNPIADMILSFSALGLLIWQIFRTFSRNLYKRRRENAVFMRVIYKFKSFFTVRKRKWKERKTHKYKKCPACKAQLRLPKKNCKIQVTCPKCGKRFTMKV